MPRVNNEVSAVANRFIEKTVALSSELAKYRKVRTQLAALPPIVPAVLDAEGNTVTEAIDSHAEMRSMATDYLRKVEADRDSLATTILGMHNKMVSDDWDKLVSFAQGIAKSLVNDADANHSEILRRSFPSMFLDVE